MNFQCVNIRDIMKVATSLDGIIVDVRETDQFLEGHIPTAMNIPLSSIENGIAKIPRNRYLILYCSYGGASMKAAKILSDAGYPVVNTIGGLLQYNKSLTLKH